MTQEDSAPATTAKQHEGIAPGLADLNAPDDFALVGKSVTINRPRSELYAFWRDFSRLPDVMDNVERIEMVSATRSHWVVRAPGGRSVEWDADVTEDRDGELIAWASVEGADIRNSGRIEFRDAGARGTIVTATIAYDPPGGVIGQIIAKLFQREPAIQTRRDLRRFKQLMETGEIATNARTVKQLEAEKA
ncbi:SRPBCC family protein [Novosphingobium sp.]|uniref:SRPBCC family protein n=1 Tax=Novosphingobium sp. TaxID=1874826 RepID=UPI003D1352DF